VSNRTNLDITDLEILRTLSEDSSIPFVDIAEKIGVADGTIHQRVRKLKRSGAIKRFTIELNNEIIGKAMLVYWPMDTIGLIPHYDLVIAAEQ